MMIKVSKNSMDFFGLFSRRQVARKVHRGQHRLIRHDTPFYETVVSQNPHQRRGRIIQTYERGANGTDELISEKHIMPYPTKTSER